MTQIRLPLLLLILAALLAGCPTETDDDDSAVMDDDDAMDDDDVVDDDDSAVADDDDAVDDDDTKDDDDAADDDDSAPTIMTFTSIWTSVISSGCSCHAGSTHNPSGFAFDGDQQTAYDMLVGAASTQVPSMDRVEPGDSTASYFMHKLDGTHASVGGSGEQMPRSGCCLDQAVRDDIRAWIDAGANNN